MRPKSRASAGNKRAEQAQEPTPSSIEKEYDRLIRDFGPIQVVDFSGEAPPIDPRRIRTYITYSAYEDPI